MEKAKTLLRDFGKAIWYMTKAGLLYGGLLGGLFGVGMAILSGVTSPYVNDVSELINYCLLTGAFGAVFGGVVGLIVGAMDAPMLIILMRVLLHKASAVNGRREFIKRANALLTGVGAFIAFTELFGTGVISGDERWRNSLVFFVTVAFIAGGTFWRITRDYMDKTMWANASI